MSTATLYMELINFAFMIIKYINHLTLLHFSKHRDFSKYGGAYRYGKGGKARRIGIDAYEIAAAISFFWMNKSDVLDFQPAAVTNRKAKMTNDSITFHWTICFLAALSDVFTEIATLKCCLEGKSALELSSHWKESWQKSSFEKDGVLIDLMVHQSILML